MLAGFVVGGLSSYGKVGLEQSVKCGSKCAVIATVVASACFALMLRALPGSVAALHGLLIPLVSALPAILMGTIGATLGALMLRRAEESEIPPPKAPKFFNVAYSVVILVSGLITALCPLVPKRFSFPESSNSLTPFHHSPSEGMTTLPAMAWNLVGRRTIGYLDPNRPFAISNDERFVAGVNEKDFIVYDLVSEASQRVSGLASSVTNLAFSPQGDRLFYVSDREPRRIGVVDLKSRTVIPLPKPKKQAIPLGHVAWWRENEVIFFDNQSHWTLNLESLEIDPSQLEPEEIAKIERRRLNILPRNERWSMSSRIMFNSVEVSDTHDASGWSQMSRTVFSISDPNYRIDKCFPEIELAGNDFVIGASDGSRILHLHRGEATVFYFGQGTIPPLRWNIAMPHGTEKLKPLDSAKEAIELGELYLMMYEPLTNPLTGWTIGPDRSRPKAILRFSKWDELEAEICLSAQYYPFRQGDVLADVYRTANKENSQLLTFDTPHRWWMIAPPPSADATEVKKLPSNSELQNRWSAATIRIAEEETKKRAEASRLAAEKQAAKSAPTPNKWDDISNLQGANSNREESDQSQSSSTKLLRVEREITKFVVEHHQKATRSEIAEMVGDYAQQVDHFNNGVVSRMFIYNDEVKYHQKMEKLTEEVEGEVKVRVLGNGVIEARYVMANFWRRQDGKSGRARNEITLEVVKQNGIWQIVKHRSTTLK
jgi:hypothetical protein